MPNCSITNLQIDGFGMWLIVIIFSNFAVIIVSHNSRYYTYPSVDNGLLTPLACFLFNKAEAMSLKKITREALIW